MVQEPRIKILGIMSSPRKKHNTEVMLKEALEGAKEAGNVETDILYLADLDLHFCEGCYGCKKAKKCVKHDDGMNRIYKKLAEEFDGFIIATPVYFRAECAQLKTFIDRLQPLCWPDYHPLTNKVFIVLSTGGARHGGQEVTIEAVQTSLMDAGMIPVPHEGGDHRGCWSGIITRHPADRSVQVLQDKDGLQMAKESGRKVAEIARALKTGLKHTKYASAIRKYPTK